MAEGRRILLVRLDGLGDALACVPALEGLRDALPGARFGALCSPRNSTLFSPRLVEPIHVWEGPRSTAALEAGLRSAGYTDALVATEEPLGYRLARASGARRRAGFWHRLEKTFKSIWQFGQLTDAVYRPAAWVARPEHEVAALYRLAQALGARLPIPDDPAYLSRWLDVSTPDAEIGRDAFAFQIAAKLGRGGWGPEAIARVAAVTVERAPLRRCVFLAGPGDEGLARAVIERMPPGRAVLARSAGTSSWLASIASAGAVVTPDTGAAHAAGMLGVPVIDLFEPERFDQLSRQWRPWAAPSRCLVKPAYAPGAEPALASDIAGAMSELLQPAVGRR
jgi:ADP-heptose:LPS heptosyltransferase